MLCDQCRAALPPKRPKFFLPETITVLHMFANNANREEPMIQSIPGDSATFEMKPPYTIDLNLCPWYKPAKSYLITYLKNGRVMIYIKSTNLVGTRMFRDKRGVLERGTIEDCRTTGGHLQVIELREYYAHMSAMSVLEKKEEQGRLKREQKRLKEERTRPGEGRSLRWSERLGLTPWFPLFKGKQQAAIPSSGLIGDTFKSTLTESFHEPSTINMTTTISSLQTLVDD